jgi:DNA repair protein RecO (recombination protein O)
MTVSRQGPFLAYVLHRYDWSESSLVLDVFTREQGRLVVVAKGAKRPYSQLRCVLLPFHPIELLLSRSLNVDDLSSVGVHAREVQTLRSAQWVGGATVMHGAVMFSAFYLNELLMKLLARQDPYPLIFDAYAWALSALVQAQDGLAQESVLRAFELTLLLELGVLPDLSLVTLTQQALQPELHYKLWADAGVGLNQPPHGGITGQVMVGLQAALRHGSLVALQQICAQNLIALRSNVKPLLAHHLGASRLRTRQVMRSVHALSETYGLQVK